ncbi:MAG: hypothetical protein RIS47_930, partial [Bacteroidota bacterium]
MNQSSKIGKALRIQLVCAVAFVLLASTSVAQQFVQLDSARIAQTKKTIKNGSATVATMQVYKKLLKDADKIIPRPNPTIIDKPEAAPSGDLHDYLSLSRYWWPDPNKKDGLPWIKKDGETNP